MTMSTGVHTVPPETGSAGSTGNQERRGWFTTLFGGGASTAPHYWGTQNDHSCRQEPAEPLLLLAEGDAFYFKVFLAYEWRGYAENREELLAYARDLHSRARRTAANWIRPIARRHLPHHARELEAEINRWATEKRTKLVEGDRTFTVTVTARVEPDDAVVEQLRPYWADRIKAECEHELGVQRARQAQELTRLWSEVFDQLATDPRAAHAAKLLEHPAFAEVFGSFVGERKQAVQDIVSLLRAAVQGHDDAKLGPSEFTRAWDAALKAFQRQHGLQTTED
jgi:hypothetical protein